MTAIEVKFHPNHLADLRESGLSDAIIDLMGVYSVCAADIPQCLGWSPDKVESALAFHYPGLDFVRFKVFPPFEDAEGHTVKYLQPKNSGVHLYTLPPVREILTNPLIPLYFTEGEKKAARAVQDGFMCIALGGLWNWIDRKSESGIDELNSIAWADRETIIVPDSDIWTRPDLQKSVYAFGKELEQRGAKVSIVVIPQDNDRKVGLDDYLVTHPVTRFSRLKKLTLKHRALKQHDEWWKQWKKRKKIHKATGMEGHVETQLPTNVSLIQVHAAQQELSSSPYSGDALELCLAVAASLHLGLKDSTPPVWLLIVGPPSSDKTETVLSLSLSPDIYRLDTLTENSFITGYLDPTGNPQRDLLAELNEKCLLVKDYTTLFSLKDDIIKRLLGDMQSIYDGSFARYTGTRGRVAYDTSFSHIGCITPLALSSHQRYMAMIGGRFLFYRALPLTEAERDEGFRILWETKKRREKINEFRLLASGFLHQLVRQKPPVIRETENQKREIERLALLLAHGRAVIRTHKGEYLADQKDHEKKHVVVYEPEEVQIEEPFRAAMQLRTLGQALTWIHGRDYLTDHDLELLRRVVLSTMPVDRASVLTLFQRPEKLKEDRALTRSLCKDGIGKSYNRANQLLTELVMVKILDVEKDSEGKGEPNVYRPLPRFDSLIRKQIEPLDHILDLAEIQNGDRAEQAQDYPQGGLSQVPGHTLTQNSP